MNSKQSSLDSLEDAYYHSNPSLDEISSSSSSDIISSSEINENIFVSELTENHHLSEKKKKIERVSNIETASAMLDSDWRIDETYHDTKSDSSDSDENYEIPKASPRNDEKDPSISECGQLDVSIQYTLIKKQLLISSLQPKNIPQVDRGGLSLIEIHAVILPKKKKRFQTKPLPVDSPKFPEIFKARRVLPEHLHGLGIRFRIYALSKFSKNQLIGEAYATLAGMKLTGESTQNICLQLEPRKEINKSGLSLSANLSNDSNSVVALTHGGAVPEILISLAYKNLSGRLEVGVEKATHLHNLSSPKPPGDTYIQFILLNSTYQEMARSKTSIRKAQPNPVFKETFCFQVAESQLDEVSLLVNVYRNLTLKRNSLFGWISLGVSATGEEESQHWEDMKNGNGNSITKWHTLSET